MATILFTDDYPVHVNRIVPGEQASLRHSGDYSVRGDYYVHGDYLFADDYPVILFTGACCNTQTADYTDCRLQTADCRLRNEDSGPQTHAYILMPLPSDVDVLPPALRFNNDMLALRICSSSCSVKQHS